MTGLGAWDRLIEHWPIAAAMALGSYFAGSTPMGGGTIGFPVLTLLFDYPASLGRNFGLAVQSVGMVSASIFILSRRRALDWAMLRPALAGAVLGTPLGAVFIAPFTPDLLARLLFAVIWAAFGVIHWLKLNEIVAPNGPRTAHDSLDTPIGLMIGVGGCERGQHRLITPPEPPRSHAPAAMVATHGEHPLAEREGFEPSERLRAQRFSRPPRSTTPAPLRTEARCVAKLEA